MRTRAGLGLIGALTFGLLAMSPAWAQTAEVSVRDNSYSPREVEVEPGTTITWTNEGEAPHTVTADNGSFDSGNMDSGDDFSETFPDPGRYPYYCEYHGGPGGEGMAGVVVVTGPTDGNGNGGGDGNGGDGDGDDPTDTAAADTGDDGDIPQTGTEIDAFVYLAFALIVGGAVLMKLGSPTAYRR